MTAATGIPGVNRRLSDDEPEEKVRDQIEYDCLLTDSNKEELDEIVSIIVEVLATNGENFIMSGMTKPADIVMKNYLALTCEHIQYVFSCFEHIHSDMRTIRQYLRASLYNAPMTMYSSTAAEVRRDFDFSSTRKKPSYPHKALTVPTTRCLTERRTPYESCLQAQAPQNQKQQRDSDHRRCS